MLQREGFVVTNMSASASPPSLLHRSSWKAEAIRRGDLKISGPIPITEDTPLNDEEEKKYAENAARNEATHPPDTSLEEQRQQSVSPPRPLHSPPAVSDHPMPLRSNLVAEQSQQHEEAQEHPPVRSPLNMQPVTIIQRDSVVPQSGLASPTPFRSTPESAAAKNVQKKRKSGLRNVFRKMFGKKSPEPEHHQEEETTRRGHSYHHSDPGLLRSTPPTEARKSPSPAGPRISDLPVKELEPLHPLGQHLPYPMNVNAPPVSPPDEYLTFDVNRPDLGRRRATLPTIPSAVAHRHSLDESRPNMATWDERQEEDEISPSGIGIAVSSPFQATSKPDRRRSRSADALHDIAKGFASTERRRSAEIKYWRQSYMSASVYSRPGTARSAEPETLRSVQMQEPTFQEPEVGSFNEMSATLVQADDPQTPTSPEAEPPKHMEDAVEQVPVSNFNFGDLDNAVLVGPPPAEREPVHEPAKEEISPEQSLPSSSEKRVSIEERVARLETKYSDLETLTHRLSSRNNRQTIILENAPRNLRSRDRSTSVSASRSHSRSAPSIHQELRRQSSSAPVADEPVPVTNSPTWTAPVAHGPSNTEQAKALQDMHAKLELERNARIALEHRVQTFQDDLSNLHALVNKLIASGATTSPSYPTPSPDMLILSSSEDSQRMSCSTPRANSRNQDTNFYSHGAQHGWRHDSESVYSEDLAQRSSTEGVASPDEWITPKEEGFSGSGFFRHGDERGVRTYA